MTIQTKINIGDPALIYVDNGLRLGVCNSISYNGRTISYQFDTGDSDVKIDEADLDNRVFYALYDGAQFMKEMELIDI